MLDPRGYNLTTNSKCSHHGKPTNYNDIVEIFAIGITFILKNSTSITQSNMYLLLMADVCVKGRSLGPKVMPVILCILRERVPN